jgi:hypothetical protein
MSHHLSPDFIANLLLEINRLLLLLCDIQDEISECRRELSVSMNDPSGHIDQKALKEQIKRHRRESVLIFDQVKRLYELNKAAWGNYENTHESRYLPDIPPGHTSRTYLTDLIQKSVPFPYTTSKTDNLPSLSGKAFY